MITCIFEKGFKANLRHVVVDTLVIDGNKILLVKRASNLSNPGKWAIIGGFVNRDETTKQAATREVREETGYEVEISTLFRINDNPNRPKENRQNIAFVYLAKPIKKITGHDKEVSELKWFELDKLPVQEDFAFDHYENIELYKKYLKQKFPLPLLLK